MVNIRTKERFFWMAYACFLVLLFLMSSTDLIIKEKKQEIYSVAVIIEDSKDEYYVNFKKGMDQAAIDYNVDVSFITLYERNHVGQQEDMVNREAEDGAQAIILAPVEEPATLQILEGVDSNVPVILLNSQMIYSQATFAISPDFFEAGSNLARNITAKHGSRVPVYIFTEGLKYQSNSQIYDGLLQVFQEHAYTTTLVDRSLDYGYQSILENLLFSPRGEVIMVALDTETMVSIASKLEDLDRDPGIYLYGTGSNMQILNLMDRGVIQGVFTVNQYDAGYLSMEKAVEAIQNRILVDQIQLPTYYLEKQDIRKPEYEKMLYPID